MSRGMEVQGYICEKVVLLGIYVCKSGTIRDICAKVVLLGIYVCKGGTIRDICV